MDKREADRSKSIQPRIRIQSVGDQMNTLIVRKPEWGLFMLSDFHRLRTGLGLGSENGTLLQRSIRMIDGNRWSINDCKHAEGRKCSYSETEPVSIQKG